MKVSKGLTQAYQVQDLAFEALMQIRRETIGQPLGKDAVTSLAALGRLWVDAQERIRVHRGKPLPGSRRPPPQAPPAGPAASGLS